MSRLKISSILVAGLGAFAAVSFAQPPPPAPVMSPSRMEVIKMLGRADVERCLPITLGTGAPTAVLRREGERWVIRRLELDVARADEARREGMARDGRWMPEDEWGFLRPGRILLEAPSRAALREAIERMTDWSQRQLGSERPPGRSRAADFCRR